MNIEKLLSGMKIKRLEDMFELQLLKEGDRVIIYYNEGTNKGPIMNSNIKPEIVYGDYKNFEIKSSGYGGIILNNSLELFFKFRELNKSSIEFLEELRIYKKEELNEEKYHDINGFYNSPEAFGIYLIRDNINISE